MLKKLQVKFVALVMGVVVLILGGAFLGIGVMTYQQAWERLSADMAASIDISANAPLDRGDPRRGEAFQGDDSSAPPQIGGRPDERLGTPVAVYEWDGSTLSLASRSGALLAHETLASLAEFCAAAPFDELTASSEGLVLLKRHVRGSTFVAFANDSARESVGQLMVAFAVVGAAALLAFFGISILFSYWALKPVRQAWKQQREFISNASHELKTPLAVIKANTEILLDERDLDEATRAKWLSSTREATNSMEELVDDMLALASLDELEARRDDLAQRQESVDLSRLVEGKVLQFESRAFEGSFRLESTVPEGVAVHADEEAVTRLLQILLDNACKYVNTGGVVKVQLERDGAKKVVLSVSNTGKAIPPESLERIFDRFYRADDAYGERDGYGLGLAIAKGLSHQLGAVLTAASCSEETRFTLRL